MKFIKKSLVALIALGSVLVLAGCGQQTKSTTKSNQSEVSKVKIPKTNLNQLNSTQRKAYQEFQEYIHSSKGKDISGATFNIKQNTEELYLSPRYLKEYKLLRNGAKKLSKQAQQQKARKNGKVNQQTAINSLALAKTAMKLSQPIRNIMLAHQNITKSSQDKGLQIEIANNKSGFPKNRINQHILTPKQTEQAKQALDKTYHK